MFRTDNTEKMNQPKPKARTAMFTILWFVLFAAAMLFIALAVRI
jgi:hypothetical protein